MLTCCPDLFAADESFVQVHSGQIKKGDTLTVVDDKFKYFSNVDWNQVKNISVKNIVSFEIRTDTSFYYQSRPFTCSLKLKIEYFKTQDQEYATELQDVWLVVAVDTSVGSVNKLIDKLSFANGHRVKVTVESIESPEYGDSLPPIFRIKNQIVVKRVYPFDPAIKADVSMNILFPNLRYVGSSVFSFYGISFLGNNSQVLLSWHEGDLAVPGGSYNEAEEYDLEWTFVDQYDESATLFTSPQSPLTSQLDALMFNNSTRVTLSKVNSYRIPIVYPQGFLVARIRRAGYTEDGVRVVSTNWSYGLSNENWYMPIPGHEANLTWQYTANYAEGGKRKELISYFDASLKNRQNITIRREFEIGDNSNPLGIDNEFAIVAEDVYDQYGRKTVSILPGPTPTPSLGFKPGFNLNATNTAVSYADLVSGIKCSNILGELSNASGTSKYYSGQNSFLSGTYATNLNYFAKYVPDAEGFPYSITQYLNDPTGRVRAQGGVGKAFQLGKNSNYGPGEEVHPTQYFYGKPLQSELYRIFGPNIGKASHYIKNAVVDANGQISVSYLNAAGQVIATALAGLPPENVEALPSFSDYESSTKLVQSLFVSDDFRRDAASKSLQATTSFLSTTTGEYVLEYQILPNSIQTSPLASDEFCTTCYYELEVVVRDDCGEVKGLSSSVPFLGETMNCSPEAFKNALEFQAEKIGAYYITYTIKLSDAVLNEQVERYITLNTDLHIAQQLLEQEFDLLEFFACFEECSTCIEKLGSETDFVNHVQSIITTVLQEKSEDLPIDVNLTAFTNLIKSKYSSLYSACLAMQSTCGSSPCEEKRQQMLTDVRPGGQYARVNYNSETDTYTMLDADVNLLQYYNSPNHSPYDINFFDQELQDYVYIRDLSFSDFVKAYLEHPDWSEYFIYHHVEYCSYEWCVDNSYSNQSKNNEQSYRFDARLKDFVTSGSKASTLGYYNRTNYKGIVALDPFFNGGRGSSYKTAMENDLDNLSNVLRMTMRGASGSNMVGKNIVQFVDWVLYCKPDDVSATVAMLTSSWASCNPSESCRSIDLEWELFRTYYLQLKSRYFALVKNQQNPDCSNCFIGSDGTNGSCSGTVIDENDVPCEINRLSWQVEQTTTEVPISYGVKEVTDVMTTTVSVNGPPLQRAVKINFNRTYISHVNNPSLGNCLQTVGINAGVGSVTLQPGQTSAFIGHEVFVRQLEDSEPLCILSSNEYVQYALIGYECLPLNTCTSCPTPIKSLCVEHPDRAKYADKIRVFNEYINTDDFITCSVYTGGTPSTTTIASQVSASAIASLEASKENWLITLKEVRDAEPVFTSITNGQITELVNDLARIALKNIQVANDLFLANPTTVNPITIRAASTLPLSVTSIDGYNTFLEAFVANISAGLIEAGFGPHLLADPYPYDKSPIEANQTGSSLTSQICQQISSIKNQFLVENASGTNEQFHTWLKDHLNDYFWSASQLEEALDKCGSCRYISSSVIFPAAFTTAEGGSSDHPYVDCNRVSGLMDEFSILYPQVSVETRLGRILLTNFLNHSIGYYLTYSDYAGFTQSCTLSSTALLFNKPVNGLIEQSGSSCETDILTDLVNRVGLLYSMHLDEQRRLFRDQLLTTCLASEPSSTIEGELKEYHYTLYYYDQSGLLVKSVPPEGAGILDESQLKQIEAFKDKTPYNINCTNTSISFNSDIVVLKSEFSDFASANVIKAVELWYSTADRENSVRFMTDDQRYLIQMAIANGKVWAEVFELSVNGGDVEFLETNQHVAQLPNSVVLANMAQIVVQSNTSILTGDLEFFYNGIRLKKINEVGSSGYPFDFTFESATGTPILPASLTNGLREFRVYNRVLSKEEVNENFMSVCRYPVGSLANYTTSPDPGADKPLLHWFSTIADNSNCNNFKGFERESNRGAVQVHSNGGSTSLIGNVNSNFTYEFWVKPLSAHQIFAESNEDGVLSGNTGQRYAITPAIPMSNNDAGMGVSVGTNGVSIFEHSYNYLPPLLVWEGAVSDWTHIAIVYTNNKPSLFVNGVFVKDGLQSTKRVFPSTPFAYNALGHLNGYIDEVRVWNYQRTPNEIANNYQQSISPDASNGLVGYWPVSTSDGQVIKDQSCSNNHRVFSSTFLSWTSNNLVSITDNVYNDELNIPSYEPNHRLATTYQYNSFNAVVRQNTPDAGVSRFFYDRLGRLSLSQNAKQFIEQDGQRRFSFSMYDQLNRVFQTGEMYTGTSRADAITEQNHRETQFPYLFEGRHLIEFDWINYDKSGYFSNYLYNLFPPSLEGKLYNLRNRVSSVVHYDGGSTTVTPSFSSASFYSYDISGNVKTLYTQQAILASTEQVHNGNDDGIKKIDYDYDLISGKVNKVLYQDGKWDQFYHWYKYDAENRLTHVYTSRDNVDYLESEWNREARYQYYLHGPLARTIMGQNDVQGVDYAYTLQGWLKGVNAQHLNKTHDMGQDGNASGPFANVMPDVFGYSLGYFKGDYKPIGTGVQAFASQYTPPSPTATGQITGKDLFNGNISHATYAVSLLGSGNTVGNTYRYDQLNRLKMVNRHSAIGLASGWSNSSITTAFRENFVYDANGNLLSTHRSNQSGQAMDQLTYAYHREAGGQLLSNRLKNVQDPSSPQVENNYEYDEIGNLIKDDFEAITNIEWSVKGKINRIDKSDGSSIQYSYDPSGNRVGKTVTGPGNSNPVHTFYVRDAQGNTMAVYEKTADAYKWTEQHLYGSSRLGIFKPNFVIPSNAPLSSDEYVETNDPAANGIFGKKFFELSNHLGNVMVTLSDRVIQQQVGGNLLYSAEPISGQDYFAFGGIMPGRQVNVEGYRYGFNGQEMSNEIKGVGNSYTAEFWEYDPRLGRRWNLDPRPNLSISSYAAFANNPILFSDPFGDTTVRAANGTHSVDIDENLNTLEFYNSSENYIKGTSVRTPSEAGQLRSFTNELGTFSARWTTGPDGQANFAGYLNDQGQDVGGAAKAINEVLSSWKFKIFSYMSSMGESIIREHDRDPVAFNLQLATSMLMMHTPGTGGFIGGGRSRFVTTLDDMSTLGRVSKGFYIPKAPLLQQEVAGWHIPIPDKLSMGYSHTTLGGKVGSDGMIYRQSATFTEGTWPLANGIRVPWSRVDWTSHGRRHVHPNPHQHIFFFNQTRWEYKKAVPFQ